MFSKKEHQIKIPVYEKSRLTPDLYFQIQLENEISRNDLDDVKTLVRVLRKNSTFLVNKTLRKLLNLDSTLKKREVIRNHIFRLTEQAFKFLDKYQFWLLRFNELGSKKLVELKKFEEKRKKFCQKLEIPRLHALSRGSDLTDTYEKNLQSQKSQQTLGVSRKKHPLTTLFELDVSGRTPITAGLTNRLKECSVYWLTFQELSQKYRFHSEEFLYLVVKMLLNYASIKFW